MLWHLLSHEHSLTYICQNCRVLMEFSLLLHIHTYLFSFFLYTFILTTVHSKLCALPTAVAFDQVLVKTHLHLRYLKHSHIHSFAYCVLYFVVLFLFFLQEFSLKTLQQQTASAKKRRRVCNGAARKVRDLNRFFLLVNDIVNATIAGCKQE